MDAAKRAAKNGGRFLRAHEKVISTKGISSHLSAVCRKKHTLRSVGERDEWQVLCLFDAAARSARKTRVIYEFSLFSLIGIFSAQF
jgi:hypothetical protein